MAAAPMPKISRTTKTDSISAKLSSLTARNGNPSLAAGALFSLSSIACPCPVCIGSSLLFLGNGVREKLAKR